MLILFMLLSVAYRRVGDSVASGRIRGWIELLGGLQSTLREFGEAFRQLGAVSTQRYAAYG